MSYIDDLTEALVKVTSHAASEPTEKFVGYAVNREFWVDEAAHVLAVIDGYNARFEKMNSASVAYPEDQDHQRNARDMAGELWQASPITIRSESDGDLSRARLRIRDSMKRFLSRCIKVHPQLLDAVMDDCHTLGIQTPI